MIERDQPVGNEEQRRVLLMESAISNDSVIRSTGSKDEERMTDEVFDEQARNAKQSRHDEIRRVLFWPVIIAAAILGLSLYSLMAWAAMQLYTVIVTK